MLDATGGAAVDGPSAGGVRLTIEDDDAPSISLSPAEVDENDE